jgi:hypothetical protein
MKKPNITSEAAMANQSKYTPEELAKRIEEILSGTGEPYVPGEDPAVDAAMHLRNTIHPTLNSDKVAAIGASLTMSLSAAQPPTLSNDAFNEIAAKLQAQAQLQAAPKPVMSDEAFNRIAMELQLRNAPKPVMSDAALLRIEQQLLQATRPGASYLTIVAILVIAIVGGLLAMTVMLNNDTIEAVPDGLAEIPVPSATPQVVESTYSTDIQLVEVMNVEPEPTVDEPEPVPTEIPTQIAPTAEPIPETEVIAVLPNAGNIIGLPSVMMTEGTIEAVNDETLVVFDMTFTFAHDPSIADGYEAGDTVHIEGMVDPRNPESYIIVSIAPIIDIVDDRPVLVSIGVEPEPTDETPDDGIDNPDVTITTTDTTISGSTGTTTVDAPDDECVDGDDRNLGRGQECNEGQIPSQGQSSGSGQQP